MDQIEMLTKSFGDHSDAVKTALDKAARKDDEFTARMAEVEQKLVRGNGMAGADRGTSWGAQVATSDLVKGLNSNWKGRARIEVKATTLTSLTTDAPGSAGDLLAAQRGLGMIEMPRRKLPLRALFAPGRTAAGAIEWPKQTGRTLAAATQVEGDLKAQSDLKFDLVTWPVRTIAHFMVASKQILDDVPALQSIIDSELRYGLEDAEESQLLNGGGTGADLVGVYTTASPYVAPFVPSGIGNLTKIDVLLLAIAQVEAAGYEADGIVLHPLDWRDLQLLKDEIGQYLGAGPFTVEQVARLWSMPVVTTTSMTLDRFMVGACREGAQIFDRQEATVEISTEDVDNFRRNLCTVRGEERLAFVIKHADAFVKGVFAEALAA